MPSPRPVAASRGTSCTQWATITVVHCHTITYQTPSNNARLLVFHQPASRASTAYVTTSVQFSGSISYNKPVYTPEYFVSQLKARQFISRAKCWQRLDRRLGIGDPAAHRREHSRTCERLRVCHARLHAGLDSASTFTIVQSLTNWSHATDATIVIGLLQPEPQVFEQFDDVLLLANGRIAYHGPREAIEPYFFGLGFEVPEKKAVADFLQARLPLPPAPMAPAVPCVCTTLHECVGGCDR